MLFLWQHDETSRLLWAEQAPGTRWQMVRFADLPLIGLHDIDDEQDDDTDDEAIA